MHNLLIGLIVSLAVLAALTAISLLEMCDKMKFYYHQAFRRILDNFYQRQSQLMEPLFTGRVEESTGLKELSEAYVHSILNRKRRSVV